MKSFYYLLMRSFVIIVEWSWCGISIFLELWRTIWIERIIPRDILKKIVWRVVPGVIVVRGIDSLMMSGMK